MNEEQREHYLQQQRNIVQQRRDNMDEEQREQHLEHEREIYMLRVLNMDNEQIAQRRERDRQRQHLRRNGNADAQVEPFNMGEMNVSCEHCRALKFWNESFNCCNDGKVHLPPLQPYPEELKPLFDGRDEEL